MDIPRRERKSRRKYLYGGVIVGAIVLGTTAVGGLGSGVPSVEGASLWRDVVRRGTMLRQVRGPGTLVPEQIRWVPAVTAGRVERKLVLPGTRVEPGTLLLELSNPDVRLEMLEAERQLSAAQAALVSLRTSLQTLRLSQAAVVASVRAQSLKAQRDARAATQLAENDLMSDAEVATAKEHAEELATRLAIEEQRLTIQTETIEPQLEVQLTQIVHLENIVEFHRQRIASMQVRAGTEGVLQDIPIEEGQWVLPGQTLARVVRPERLKAQLRVPEIQARDIVVGQRVLIDTRTDTIPGRVVRLDPAVQNGTLTIDVALTGDLPPGARPDLSIDGMIEIDRLDDVIYVGRPAFGRAESTVSLFRIAPGGKSAERVRVRFGLGSVNSVEIIDGLSEGDVIVLSDMSQWDAVDRIRIR